MTKTRNNKRKSFHDCLSDIEDENVKRCLTIAIKQINQAKEKIETQEAEIANLKDDNKLLIGRLDGLDNQLQQLQSTAPAQGSVELVEKSGVFVNPLKLELSKSNDWATLSNNLVTCLFSVSEVYRRNLGGGRAKTGAQERQKLAINLKKMNALREFVKQECKDFYEKNAEKNKWKALINVKVNNRLGKLNRHFIELIDTHHGRGPAKPKHTITKDDQHLFEQYDEFKRDPTKFADLDREIEDLLSDQENIIEGEVENGLSEENGLADGDDGAGTDCDE